MKGDKVEGTCSIKDDELAERGIHYYMLPFDQIQLLLLMQKGAPIHGLCHLSLHPDYTWYMDYDVQTLTTHFRWVPKE